jgi:CheY-like chemotaxis protein
MTELKRILLVEDSVHDIELTLNALAPHHLADEVVVVRDGAEALDYLYRRGAYQLRAPGNPVVVLLDLQLPKVDGMQVLRSLKSDNAMKSVPVVMLTASREGQDLVSSYGLGANAYVVKPVDFAAFAQALGKLGLFWAAINEPPPGSVGRHRGGGAPHAGQ